MKSLVLVLAILAELLCWIDLTLADVYLPKSNVPTFSDCFGEVTEPGTIITNEHYPEPYLNIQDCGVEIKFKEGQAISVTFLDFDLGG